MSSYIKDSRFKYKAIMDKLASGELDSDCVFNHHNHTPDWLVDMFWNNRTFKTFATCNLEFLFHQNVLSCKEITFFTSCKNKEYVAQRYLTKIGVKFTIIKYTYDFANSKLEFEKDLNMEFDGVFLNSPYSVQAGSSTNTTDVYPDWNKRFLSMAKQSFVGVMPRNWANKESDSFRKFIFQQQSLTELAYLPDNTFGGPGQAQVGTCYTIFDKSTNDNYVDVTDQKNNKVTVMHDADTIISWGDIRWLSIFNKIKNQSTLDSMWRRGKLNLKETSAILSSSGIEFVEAIGKTNDPIKVTKIKKGYEDCGFGFYGVGFANVGDTDKIGPVKILTDLQVVGHSVVKMGKEGMTLQESERLKTYLESNFVKKLVKAKKGGMTPNAKHLFAFIPAPDLSKDFVEKDFLKSLNLTKDEKKLFND